MIQIEIAQCNLSFLAKDPQHYAANISWTSERLQMTGDISLTQQLYLILSPRNKGKRYGVGLIAQLDHCAEAIPFHSACNPALW
jgi:hypothetical protein